MRAAALLCCTLALAACSGEEPQEPATAIETGGPLAGAPELQMPSADQLAMLGSADCRTVAHGYIEALAAGDFTLAARFWDDPVVDEARLAAVFDGYGAPTIAIDKVQEEGAAGSLYCTVTGTLADGADTARAKRQGALVLRRVNDVPGATPEQLRWHLQSSSFVEEMQRAGRGDPA